MTTTLFHNPRCSKSRETLALLQEHAISPEIVLYLETPPSKEELKRIVFMLEFKSVRELMRIKESEYKELELDNPSLTEDDLLNALVKTPKLIERPIVVHKNKAKIGRPPECVLSLFNLE